MASSDPVPVPCDFCGVSIPPEKFTEGKAVVILKKKYCPSCIKKAVKTSKEKPPPPPPPPPAAPPPPPKPTERLTIGEHACGLYASEDERRAQMAPFVREGFLKGHKILYLLDEATPERILGDFKSTGVSVQSLLQKGQLQILSASKLREGGGTIDLLDIASKMAVSVDRAAAQGFEGLRIVCDMTWALSSLIAGDRLIEFELQLVQLTTGGRCAALCQYNVYRVEASPLNQIRKNHTVVLAKGTAQAMLKELAGSL